MQALPKSESPVRVLIAEDEQDVRDLLCDTLRDHGYTVTAVEDGAQAIRAFRDQDFDVVLTDLAMPGYSGLQVAEACRRQRPSVKVVMFTAWDLLLDDDQCIHHGVDRLIPKPLRMSSVLEALRQVGDQPRFQRAPRTSV
jgi:CheY-like chemotaxis protein